MKKVARRLGLTNQKIEFHVCVELPDYPFAREWMQWYTSPTRANAEEDVPVMLTSQDQWRDRPAELRSIMQALICHGSPCPSWTGMWTGAGEPRSDAPGGTGSTTGGMSN